MIQTLTVTLYFAIFDHLVKACKNCKILLLLAATFASLRKISILSWNNHDLLIAEKSIVAVVLMLLLFTLFKLQSLSRW